MSRDGLFLPAFGRLNAAGDPGDRPRGPGRVGLGPRRLGEVRGPPRLPDDRGAGLLRADDRRPLRLARGSGPSCAPEDSPTAWCPGSYVVLVLYVCVGLDPGEARLSALVGGHRAHRDPRLLRAATTRVVTVPDRVPRAVTRSGREEEWPVVSHCSQELLPRKARSRVLRDFSSGPRATMCGGGRRSCDERSSWSTVSRQVALSRRELIAGLLALGAAAGPAGGAPDSPAPIEVSGLDHLALRVRDVERSTRFYTRHLGATVRSRSSSSVFLDVGAHWIALFGPRAASTSFGETPRASTT